MATGLPGNEGELYYQRAERAGFGAGGQPSLRRFSFESREEETLMEGANAFVLSHDKKNRAGRTVFVLPTAIGRVEVKDDVTTDEVMGALRALREREA